jgi:hypothetical protein
MGQQNKQFDSLPSGIPSKPGKSAAKYENETGFVLCGAANAGA